MIQNLWDQQVKTIISIKIGDADTDSYKHEPMSALLHWRESIKKTNHGKYCNNQLKYFSLFVISIY